MMTRLEVFMQCLQVSSRVNKDGPALLTSARELYEIATGERYDTLGKDAYYLQGSPAPGRPA